MAVADTIKPEPTTAVAPVKTGPDWPALMASYEEGASDVEIAKQLGVTMVRFYDLIETTPAFADFVDKGRTMAQAWWYEQGRRNLWNKDFNTTLWNFQMKNKYFWSDKVESKDTTGSEPTNLDEAKAQLQSALKKLSKKNPELVSGEHLKGGV